LAMTGDKLSAEAAERMGLIWTAVDDAALNDQTMALAARLAAMPTKALAATRRTIDEAIMFDYSSALSLEARVQNEMGAQPDFREGVAAFLEKRAAKFNDR
jgi:2-(1,2-epoxy-1,2-dihydrophenyl)acetyl-CoA isomerase